MKRVIAALGLGIMLVGCGQNITADTDTMVSTTQTEQVYIDKTLSAQATIYQVLAQCNIQVIDPKLAPNPPARVTGRYSDKNEEVACREAKRIATQSAPRGTYARHCQCKTIRY